MSKLKGKSWKRKTQRARNLRARSSPIPRGDSILASAIIFLQLNDVYFIDARADYSRDDGLLLPRVATVIKRLRKRFPVVVCIPGDFLAPSCMSKLFHGKQMISVLNHVGVDYATFGNHEFEEFITPAELARLMRKSKFKWLSANFTTDHPALEDSFTPFDAQRFTEHVHVFITGVTYQKQFKGFGEALDPILAAGSTTTDLYRETLAEMIADGEQPEQDTFYVALTHQRIAEDRKFAQELPHFQLIMGGHDHDQLYSDWQRQSIIVKAVSNARSIRLNCLLLLNPQDVDPLRDHVEKQQQLLKSAWLVTRDEIMSRIFLDRSTPSKAEKQALPQDMRAFMDSEQRHIDTEMKFISRYGDRYIGMFTSAIRTTDPAFIENLPEDRGVSKRIARWTRIWLKKSGESVVPILVAPVALNAEDKVLRTCSTNLGNLAADIVRGGPEGVTWTNEVADISLVNSGALRIDRIIQRGEGITQRTLCDLLFHTKEIRVYRNVPGAHIRKILETSWKLRVAGGEDGDGDFVQMSGLRVIIKDQKIVGMLEDGSIPPGTPLQDDKLYRVACSAFTHVTACRLAEFSMRTRCIEVLQSKSLPPSPAPIATGWSDQLPGGIRTH